MTSEPPVISQPPFRDRSGGLMGFGILLIVLGGFCALFVPLMLLTLLAPLPPELTDDGRGRGSLLTPILMYAGLAVALIWLGIGSLKAQRWARTLIMILSCGTLFGGIWTTLLMLYFANVGFPGVDNASVPLGARTSALAFAAVVLGLLFVVLPATLAWFYSRRDVKATCENRNPYACWTDACPAVVLALSLWQAFGAATLIFLLVGNHGVVPVFGQVLSGATGMGVCLVQAAAMGYCAWMLYHLKPAGWWLAVFLVVVSAISITLNSTWLDYGQLYQAMGYSTARIQQLLQYNFMQGGMGLLNVAVFTLPVIILLGLARRHFRTQPSERL